MITGTKADQNANQSTNTATTHVHNHPDNILNVAPDLTNSHTPDSEIESPTQYARAA